MLWKLGWFALIFFPRFFFFHIFHYVGKCWAKLLWSVCVCVYVSCNSGHVFWYARLPAVVYVSVFIIQSWYARSVHTRVQNFVCKSNFVKFLCSHRALYFIAHPGKNSKMINMILFLLLFIYYFTSFFLCAPKMWNYESRALGTFWG